MQEGRKLSMRWWFPKGSTFWHRQPLSTRKSENGDGKPPTSRQGPVSRFLSTNTIVNKWQQPPPQEKGTNSGSTKHLKCTATPTRIALQRNIKLKHYRPGNTDAELWSVITGTSQYNPYQLQLISHGTIGTYDCDNERHTGSVWYIVINYNERNKDQ